MSIRRRVWRTAAREAREAWVVDYFDAGGVRRNAQFERKREAVAYDVKVRTEVRAGTHTAPSVSITIDEAAANWLRYVELKGKERSTVEQYRQHANLHISPRIGHERLAALTTPRVNAFRDDLLGSMSHALARKVLTSLKSILKDAQGRGDVAQNVARDVCVDVDKRSKRKLKVGTDIPTPQEIGRILEKRPFLTRRPAKIVVHAVQGRIVRQPRHGTVRQAPRGTVSAAEQRHVRGRRIRASALQKSQARCRARGRIFRAAGEHHRQQEGTAMILRSLVAMPQPIVATLVPPLSMPPMRPPAPKRIFWPLAGLTLPPSLFLFDLEGGSAACQPETGALADHSDFVSSQSVCERQVLKAKSRSGRVRNRSMQATLRSLALSAEHPSRRRGAGSVLRAHVVRHSESFGIPRIATSASMAFQTKQGKFSRSLS